jgi:hypothetical protein
VDEMITLQKIYRDIPKKNIQIITIKVVLLRQQKRTATDL